MMCRSSIIQGFRIKPACVSEGVFTATERGLKNPRTDFLIKINGVDI